MIVSENPKLSFLKNLFKAPESLNGFLELKGILAPLVKC